LNGIGRDVIIRAGLQVKHRSSTRSGGVMPSKVYFVPINEKDVFDVRIKKLEKLIEVSGLMECIEKNDRVAVKIHFGEKGNTGFVDPSYVKLVAEKTGKKNATAFLSDTNTLYKGNRTNSKDHLEQAKEHGFTRETVGLEIIIPDDTDETQTLEVRIGLDLIKKAYIGRIFSEADAMVAITHFKGHMLSGFGGAIKNIAMGCAMRKGKLAQHCDISPTVYSQHCIGCGACVRICPVQAIIIKDGKSAIEKAKCIGCANCVGVCPTGTIFVDLKAGDKMQMKMAEYAYAVLNEKKGKLAFLNFALKINKECDCWGGENPRIASDAGIFASEDPVALDKATMDLVNCKCGKDVFKSAHPEQDGTIQLEYAQKLGLGNMAYELIEIK